MNPRRLALSLIGAAITGAGLVLVGVALIFPPAALILAGLGLLATAVFVLTRDLNVGAARK